MRILTLSITAALVLSALAARGQETTAGSTPQTRFQEAWYHEMAEGRLEDALEVYLALAGSTEPPEILRARALFRAGVCLGKLQRKDESRQAFERAIKDFPEVEEIVRAAEREIKGETEADAAFRLKVKSLIERLSDGTVTPIAPGRGGLRRVGSPVLSSLREVGPRAAPFLMSALGSGDYFTCQHAAILLVEYAEDDPSILPAVIGALRSGDDIVKRGLIEALASAAGEVWTTALVDLLEDPSLEVRLASARLLGEHAERLQFRKDFSKARRNPLWQPMVSGLSRAVSDPSVDVRIEALRILGERLVAGEAMEALVSALADPEEAVRLAAVEAVKEATTFPFRDLDPLLELLDDPSREVVTAVVRVLDERQQYLDNFRESRERSVLPEGERGGEALRRLTAIARSPELASEVRTAAVRLLGASGRPEALTLLVEATRDEAADVVRAAVSGMGRMGDRSVVPVFLEVFTRSDDEDVRKTIWPYLGYTWKSAGTTRALIERLPRLGDYAEKVLRLIDWSAQRDLVLQAMPHFTSVRRPARAKMIEFVRNLGTRDGPFPEGVDLVLLGLADDDPSIVLEAAQAAAAMPDTRFVAPLIEALSSSDSKLQGTAIFALRRTGDPAAAPALVAQLVATSAPSAAAAAEALKELGDRGILPEILSLLREDADLPHPRHALDVLAQHATAADAERIGAALASMRPDVRVQAIELLGRLQSPAAAPFVRRQMEAGDPRVRQAVVTTMVEIAGGDALSVVVSALGDPDSGVRRLAAAAALRYEPREVRAQPDVLENLIASLDDQSWETRVAAVDALAYLRDPAAVPPLIDALREGDARPIPNPKKGRASSTIAFTAREALLDFGDASVIPAMLEILETKNPTNEWLDPDYAHELLERHARHEHAPLLAGSLARQAPESRRRTLRTLASLGNPEVVPDVLTVLDDEDAGVRADAVRTLARLGVEESFKGLVSSLSDRAPVVRTTAVKALGASKDPRAFPIILNGFSEEAETSVLRQYIFALEEFGNPAAIPALLDNVRDSSRAAVNTAKFIGEPPADFFRYYAVGSLRHYPPEEARKALLSILEGELPLRAKMDALVVFARGRQPGALEVVNRYTAGAIESKELRTFAISLLGSFLEKSTLPHLLELFKDPDPEIRDAARKSIDEIRYYLSQKSFAESGGSGGQALAQLLKLLSHDDAAVRLAAVKSLAELKDPESLAPLVRLRKDPDPEVRAAVDAALDALAGS